MSGGKISLPGKHKSCMLWSKAIWFLNNHPMEKCYKNNSFHKEFTLRAFINLIFSILTSPYDSTIFHNSYYQDKYFYFTILPGNPPKFKFVIQDWWSGKFLPPPFCVQLEQTGIRWSEKWTFSLTNKALANLSHLSMDWFFKAGLLSYLSYTTSNPHLFYILFYIVL
jgi:hypothetical protein